MRTSATMLLLLINLLIIQDSSAIDIPEGVYAPKEGGYVFADYPDVFDGFSNEGLTVEIWFYLTDFPKDTQEEWILIDKPKSYIMRLVSKRPVLPQEVVCEMDHMVYFSNGGLGGSSAYMSDDRINSWVHFTFSMQGKGSVQTTAFVNGKRISGGGSTGAFFASDDPLFIGGREGHNSIKGWIDEVRISKEYRCNDFKPERRFEANRETIALWHFDEGNGSNFYKDSSGNGYTLYTGGTTAVDSKSKSATTWGRLKR